MENKERRNAPKPKLNVPRVANNFRDRKVRTVNNDKLTERMVGNVSNIDQLFDDKDEKISEKRIHKEQNRQKKYNEATKIPADEWKQSFRKTDSREIVNFFRLTPVPHNALLRLSGSYSTKILSNLKARKDEVSGIENKATKVFYNFDLDISEAIINDSLSYIPYSLNYLSFKEEDITKKTYIDNLFLLGERLFFSIFMYNNEIIETESIALTKENLIKNKVKFRDERDSLKIFITEEKNIEEVVSTITKNYQQNFLLIVLNKSRKEIDMYVYSNEVLTGFTLDKLKEVALGKIKKLGDESGFEEAKVKYIK